MRTKITTINIRFFFTKDRIAHDNIAIEHCPTEHMLADFFTKPLQGALFLRFRNILMGFTHYSSLSSDPIISSTVKERVGVKTENEPNQTNINMTEPLDPEPLNHPSISVLQNNDASPEKKDGGNSPKKNDGASPKNMNRSCFSHVRKEHKDGGPHTTQTVVKPTQNTKTEDHTLHKQ
jgi:hypothetical protein